MMDKAKSLRVEPKQNLDPKDELKSINITYPSLEEALDKINLRVTNQGNPIEFMLV
jgi:hypothetical protein